MRASLLLQILRDFFGVCMIYPDVLSSRESTWPMQETQGMRVQTLNWEEPLEEEMATYSSILAWKIPWTEEPGGLVHRVTKSQT